MLLINHMTSFWFPISRDPPEGGTAGVRPFGLYATQKFPISRDPPEGGTWKIFIYPELNKAFKVSNF